MWGVPDAPHGIIDAPIGRDRGEPLKMAVVANGRFARTDYRVLGSYSAPAVVSRLECRLETGRTHQIRVHLASIGHPLVGDPTYAQRRPMLGLTRPFLHAAELAFDPPRDRRTDHVPQPARRRSRSLARRRHPLTETWNLSRGQAQRDRLLPARPDLHPTCYEVPDPARQVRVTGMDLKAGVPAALVLASGTRTLVSG